MRVNYSQGEVPSRVAGFAGLSHRAHFCYGRIATHPRKKKKKKSPGILGNPAREGVRG